ncbi:hypothetical protein KP509_11G049100 [Ceratopteris richardii]|uniref:Suppressor of forked domain-containing protein n=1 Tax=Ceratopteris richardii TaxID=49495 RepID=A0A8T2TU93_CERRI|nr:hypothetical protein KP509_11G049100 [Ceratopteris richardii]
MAAMEDNQQKNEEGQDVMMGDGDPQSDLLAQDDLLKTDKELSPVERRARERIKADRWDTEAWNMIGSEAQGRQITEAAPLYEMLLTNFPTAARYWRCYVEAQMMAYNDEATKLIFSRCLLSCLHVELWRCYIRFIRKVNENRGVEGRDETKKAFDFMLGHIGMDIGAGAVWMEYIAFLKAAPASTPQEESQRMTTVRKAYQRAVLAPIHLVEQLWKDYETFENSLSRTLAKSLLAEYQPKHFSARAVYRERKKFCERIDSSMLAVPPTGSVKEEQQCSAWKQLLTFEKANPQKLDPTSLTKRVAFTFEQCLMYLYHYPEIWYDYASWHAQNGSPESAAVVFQRAIKALPDKTLLHYAFAEFEEARGNIQEAKKVYENLVKNSATASSLAYIQFIRFTQRTEGTESALKALVEARKSPVCTYHVYVSSAMMVLCIEKDQKIARNIFEMGLKKYIHEPAYVLEYADFLCRLNDDQNVRVLFERALSVLPPEESIEVWNRFMLFEQTYGDLSSIMKVQQRRKDALIQMGDEGAASIEHSLLQLVSRYRYLDLWPCSTQELNHLSRQQVMVQRTSGKAGKGSTLQGSTASGAAEGLDGTGPGSTNIVLPDVSKMAVYDPRQASVQGLSTNIGTAVGIQTSVGQPILGLQHVGAPVSLSTTAQASAEATTTAVEEAVKILPPTLANFLSQLPIVDGPTPNVETVMAELLQLKIPLDVAEILGTEPDVSLGTKATVGDARGAANGFAKLGGRNISNLSVKPIKTEGTKRKEIERSEEEDSIPVQNHTPDVFRIRQLQRARAAKSGQAGSIGAGSTSGGSGAITGEPSGSSG